MKKDLFAHSSDISSNISSIDYNELPLEYKKFIDDNIISKNYTFEYFHKFLNDYIANKDVQKYNNNIINEVSEISDQSEIKLDEDDNKSKSNSSVNLKTINITSIPINDLNMILFGLMHFI